MNRLIIVSGISGAGKSFLLEQLGTRPGMEALSKISTRPQRKYEVGEEISDIIGGKSRREVQACDLVYTYDRHDYGISFAPIDAALANKKSPVLIVRHAASVKKLKKKYPNALAIFIHSLVSGSDLEDLLARQGREDLDIKERMKRYHKDMTEYANNLDLYDASPVNFYDSDSLIVQFDYLLEHLNQTDLGQLNIGKGRGMPLVKPLWGFKSQMEKKLETHNYEKNVFLMMKFRANNEGIYHYIRQELNNHGYNCVRADQPEWDITQDVYNPIAVLYCCKYGLALFDEPEIGNEYSPNVAYELGIMHNQMKKCLVLRHTSLQGPPFDLVKNLYSDYSDSLQLNSIITKWITKLSQRH